MNIKTLLYISAVALVACNQKPAEVINPMATKWNPDTKLANYTPNSGLVQQPAFPGNSSTANASGGSGLTLNPAHGQPGHRCDLAVGAPLNTGNTQKTVSSTQNSGINMAALAAQQQQSTAKGMNPPHGQPHHRCDIPVGAPLNSKPATPPPTTPQYASTNAAGQKLNPPHGQAGHRCDIAVGAPLDSKPASVPANPAPAQADTVAKQ